MPGSPTSIISRPWTSKVSSSAWRSLSIFGSRPTDAGRAADERALRQGLDALLAGASALVLRGLRRPDRAQPPVCLGRARPLVGALLEKVHDQLLEIRRDVRGVPRGPDRLGALVLGDHRHEVVALERRAAGGHLVQEGAERI